MRFPTRPSRIIRNLCNRYHLVGLVVVLMVAVILTFILVVTGVRSTMDEKRANKKIEAS